MSHRALTDLGLLLRPCLFEDQIIMVPTLTILDGVKDQAREIIHQPCPLPLLLGLRVLNLVGTDGVSVLPNDQRVKVPQWEHIRMEVGPLGGLKVCLGRIIPIIKRVEFSPLHLHQGDHQDPVFLPVLLFKNSGVLTVERDCRRI